MSKIDRLDLSMRLGNLPALIVRLIALVLTNFITNGKQQLQLKSLKHA